ncbi:MAG: sulfurtransferase TusA family protein [Geobacteraceae bacterium]|nr:sulfurtransferase TusA family protein [Geobacteraceae bacterium]
MVQGEVRLIDLRGVCCPTNFVKAKLALEMAGSGDILRFYLDQGEPEQNVTRSLEAEGHHVLESRKVESYCILTIEKV